MVRVPAAFAIAWLGAVGCDRVYSLDRPVDYDAPTPCKDLRPFGTTCRTIMPTLVADTALDSAQPDKAVGSADVVHITGVDPGLFKFNLSMIDPPIEPDERIAGARFRLPVVDPNGNGRACSPTVSCSRCSPSSVEASQIYFLTSGWSQLGATYNQADQGVPWEAAGGAGAERSELVAMGGPLAGSWAEVIVAADDLMRVKAECFATNEISVLATVQGAAWIRQLGNQPCSSSDRWATLELTVCK